MNILFVARAVDVVSGAGDAIHVRQLVRAWVAAGMRVDVVSMGGAKKQLSSGNATERWVGTFHLVRADGLLRLYYLRQISAFLQSLRILARQRVHLIYSRPTAGLSGAFDALPELLMSRLARVPLVVEINGWAEDEASELRASRFFIFRGLARKLSKWSLRHASGFVAVDSSLASRLSDEYRIEDARIRVVPNGVDPEMFSPRDKAESKRRVGVQTSGPVIAFVGYLGLESDLKAAIRAVALLKGEFPGIVLLILGTGQEESVYHDLASQLGVSEEVRFLGSVPHEDVPVYLSAADVGLVPMKPHLSGNPIKLFEYWACALPVVASDVPGLRTVTEVGGGLLASPNSPREWAAALRLLFLQSNVADEAGHRGRTFVAAERTWARTAQSVLRFLTSIVPNSIRSGHEVVP